MSVNNILQKNFANTRVLVRVDFNVPTKNGKVLDIARISQSKSTVDYLLNQGATVILLSHFGRPKSDKDDSCSLKHILPLVSEVLEQDVKFIQSLEPVGELKPGLYMLENVRFFAGEVENDAELVAELAGLGDNFVNDAFSVCHRNHASVAGLAMKLPSYAGLSLQADLDNLHELFDQAEHPLLAIVGGSKVSTKITVLESLISKADSLVIVGGMANTFLKAQGYPIGKSLLEENYIKTAEKILKVADNSACEIILPSNCIVTKAIDSGECSEVPSNRVAADDIIVDAGSQTIAEITDLLMQSKTVIWNGPLGIYEVAPFNKGTIQIAKAIVSRTTDCKLKSLVGGGDSLAALQDCGLLDKVSYACTAGGAFLEWLAGSDLPGIRAVIHQS